MPDDPLFPDEALPAGGVGPAEAALIVAAKAGHAAGTLLEEDEALLAAARHAARAMDWTMRSPSPKAIYAVAQSLTAYRECLHALRLPAAIAPAPPKPPAAAPTKAEDWLSDHFGTPEP